MEAPQHAGESQEWRLNPDGTFRTAVTTVFGAAEVQEMIAQGGTEVVCQFCGRRYEFTASDLATLTPRNA